MDSKWGIYSTCEEIDNNIVSYLPKSYTKITIPYVYADWLWSVCKVLKRDGNINGVNKICKTNDIEYNYINKDIILDLKKTYNLEEILRMYDNNKINFNYEKRKLESINI